MISLYIYIYMCVCVCFTVSVSFSSFPDLYPPVVSPSQAAADFERFPIFGSSLKWQRPGTRQFLYFQNMNLDSHASNVLRETQHTPGAYPRHPQTPKRKEFLHKLLVGGLGYAPGACWKVLRNVDIHGYPISKIL